MSRQLVTRLSVAALATGLACITGQALAADGPALPEGEGKALVETFCVACHQTNYINRVGGYSKDHWHELVLSMVHLGDNLSSTPLSITSRHIFRPRASASPLLSRVQ